MSEFSNGSRTELLLAGAVTAPPPIHVSRRYVLFTVLVTLNLFDVYVTRLGIERGVMAEANPLMQAVVQSFWSATALKLAVLASVAGLLVAIRPRFRVMESVLSIGIGWYAAVVAWNVTIVLGG